MLRRLLVGFVVVLVAGVLGVLILAWRPSIEPVAAASAGDFAAGLIAQGEVLAGAGYCATCHTAKQGPRNAGGLPMETGFGTIHSTNITPDVQTGIGAWSEAAFARALREGVARDGSHLFPAFPFDHFTKLTDDDIEALYAYLMTRAPVSAEALPNTVPFPLNIRALQAGWKLLFMRQGVFVADAAKSTEWNRGAYLAEGLGHCGSCHTPRNALGAEKRNESYAGAIIDGWQAPALTVTNPAPVAWSVDELFTYLRSGATVSHGSAAGPMSPVIHDGLAMLPDSDIRAIATYFADINGSAARAPDPAVLKDALARSALGLRETGNAGAHIYLAACAMCHYNAGAEGALLRPELALNSALHSADPTNLIQVVLHGVGTKEGIADVLMPPFAQALSDADIAALAGYLRRTRTDQPPWADLPAKIAEIRKHAAGS